MSFIKVTALSAHQERTEISVRGDMIAVVGDRSNDVNYPTAKSEIFVVGSGNVSWVLENSVEEVTNLINEVI